MTTHYPLDFACPHLATAQETRRDPAYTFCNAAPGQPCVWAARYDGIADPAFHSERLERAWRGAVPQSSADRDAFDRAVLATGLL